MNFDRVETHLPCDGCTTLRERVRALEEENRTLWVKAERALLHQPGGIASPRPLFIPRHPDSRSST